MYFQGNAMDNIAMTYPWSKFIGYIFSTVVEYGVNIYCNGHIIIHGYTFWIAATLSECWGILSAIQGLQ